MATWNSRGLRGSALEELINYSNEKYQQNNLGLIQKIPTPIKPITIDSKTRHITLAYFDQKSTVDYIGVIQGVPICFDAKETASDTYPLQNIHEHQIEFMRQFEQQDGVAFIIMHFTKYDELYYIPFRELIVFWDRAKAGGRKSFTYEEVNKEYKIRSNSGIIVHYIEMVQKDLKER